MTTTSIFILINYAVIHLAVILLVDWALRSSFNKGKIYNYLRWLWIIVYILLAAVPAAATFLPEEKGSLIFERYGNMIVAYEIYICGIFLTLSLIIALKHLFSGKKKKKGKRGKINVSRPYVVALIVSIVLGTAATSYGLYHAQQPVSKELTANVRGKDGGQDKEIRIVLIADLHLSVNSHVQTTRKMVQLINEAEPDAVLLAGDIFTSSYRALRSPSEYAKTLRKIKAPVYAVYGNHDVEEKLFSGFAVRPVSEAFRPETMEQFYQASGFTMLADDIIEIADGDIQLAGRIDGSKAGDGTNNRKSAGELLAKADQTRPLLVLQHEPEEYEELAEAGADMVLSGHTHGGQIFPGNLYVKLACDNGYGQKKIYGMETFVTYGIGTFGPPMRTATNSEVMVIDLKY